MVATSLFFISVLSLVAATPAVRPNFVVHEKRDAVPSGFTSNGPAPSSATINLRIGLFSNNFPGLEATLFAVSTPGSALYGQHLTLEEAKAFMEPTAESLSAVNAWLDANDLTATVTSPYGEWLTVQVPVSKANEMLDANFETFTHIETGKQIIRTLTASLPAELIPHIEALHPTTGFGRPLTAGRGPIITASARPAVNTSLVSDAVPASCATTAMYGIPLTPATQKTNSIAVAGFIQQFAQTKDLSTFLAKFRTDIPSTTTFALRTFDGGLNTQGTADAGIEANLAWPDIQYTVGLATDVPITFSGIFIFGPYAMQGFLDIINNLSELATVPQVLTTSYGEDETDQTAATFTKLCNAYAAYGTRGGSILFASGDGGVAGGQSQTCTTFLVAFPSGCPFMTSVGAVSGIPPSETAASFSSGGFSNVFTQPSYQTTAVQAYLTALGTTNAGKFTPTGRAYPDVSSQGVDFDIENGGKLEGVSGTSCSSPSFASVIGLINDRLIAAGKAPLGFLNPLGHNTGCNTNGFPAKAGWDPVTGLGTPNFAAMLSAALAAYYGPDGPLKQPSQSRTLMDAPPTKRRRSEDRDSTETETEVVRSTKYWFDDGNIILQVESTQFRLTKSMLAMHSSVFRDMFTLPLPIDEPTVENCPVVILSGDSAQDWVHFLGALYPKRIPEKVPGLALIAAILRLSKKYDCPLFRKDCLRRLKLEFPTTLTRFDTDSWKFVALEHNIYPNVISLARELGLYSILPSAYYLMISRNYYLRDILNDKGTTLSTADRLACLQGYVKLLDLQSETTMEWLDLDEGPIPSDDCDDEEGCEDALQTIFNDTLHQGRPKIYAVKEWDKNWDCDLCQHCRREAKKIFNAGRETCWKKLPSMFGLPDWKELKSLDFE
ncbi:peptidase S8/S53 domain-containing protein [Mycena galericulata]|nr:peptidase S8/S53 domain-containing protein [Mycena galericulata]